MEELEQRVLARASKIRQYEERIKQYHQNRLFTIDKNKVCREKNGQVNVEKIIPDGAECRTFWGEIWDNPISHRGDVEWLKKMKVRRASINLQQEEVRITKTQLETQYRRIPNWKAPGPDGVHGYWLKKITSCHERIAEQLDAMVCGKQEIPLWMTYGGKC